MHHIIIDTDPGTDDYQAILSALGSQKIEVLGITTVAGNVGIRKTTANALRILEAVRRTEIGVYPGADKALKKTSVDAANIHGEDGLAGSKLPPSTTLPREQHGVDFILNTLKAHPPKTVTIAALGPMTNLALALQKAPETMKLLKEIVAMGGGFGTFQDLHLTSGGNITPRAEFNIYADPEAAQIVCDSGISLTMLPLDTTHQAIITPERQSKIASIPLLGEDLNGVMHAARAAEKSYNGAPHPPLHDPTVMIYLDDPTIFQTIDCKISVSAADDDSRGETTFRKDISGKPHKASLGLNSDAFFDAVQRCISRCADLSISRKN